VTYRRIGGNLAGQTVEYSGPPRMQVSTSMAGAHQAENLALALATINALETRGWSVSGAAVERGIARMRWPARFQVVRRSPPVIIDGAHNPSGAQALRSSVEEYFPGCRAVFLMGMLNDKDLEAFVGAVSGLAAHVVATRPKSERAYAPEEVAEAFKKRGATAEVVEEAPLAIRRGLELASRIQPLIITGSLYLAGEALQHFQGVTA